MYTANRTPSCTTTLTCPRNSGYRLVMDPREVVAGNPGEGTPVMVYGPFGASGTYDCAVNTGCLAAGDNDVDLPRAVQDWLDSQPVIDEIDTFFNNCNWSGV